MKTYLKECPFDGPQDPVATGNLTLRFSIPRKCSTCAFYFEGGCKKVTNRLVRLDFGFCGIEGSKELVKHGATGKLIPQKCNECRYLIKHNFLGLCCGKDREIWGDLPRGLDS